MALTIDDVTKDLVISAGQFTEVTGLTEVSQRVRARVFTFVDEWFLDKSFGLPYLTKILGQTKPSMVVISAIFKREIRKSLGDDAILTSLNLKFDNATRKLTVSTVITAPDGVEDRDNFIL